MRAVPLRALDGSTAEPNSPRLVKVRSVVYIPGTDRHLSSYTSAQLVFKK